MKAKELLIDAEPVKKFIVDGLNNPDKKKAFGYDAIEILAEIECAPTVDAVKVVRCKDCKSWEQYNACDGSKPHRCMNLNAIFHMRTAPDDFCSYGERRADNG